MVAVDVNILWIFLSSAIVVLMQAQALHLARTNRSLAQSEHELRTRNAELDSANTRLCEMDSVKGRILSGVAQELRRPIDTLLSEAELLKRHHRDSPDLIERCSSAIVDEGARLRQLISSLLERSNDEPLNLEWNETKAEPRSIVEEALRAVSPTATLHAVALRETVEDDLSLVWAHRDRVVHALVLLIDVAVSAAPEGSSVGVECRQSGPEVVFRVVQAAGFGPTAADVAGYLGESDAGNTEASSAGFVFKLCRDIVASHHGRFWVENSVRGTTHLCVALPAIRYEPRAAAYVATPGLA